jgi:hypothetical protein
VAKLAITLRVAYVLADTVHVRALPVHAPLHPRNIPPAAGTAVSVTVVPSVYASAQSLPQLIPTGLDVTVPTLVPDRETVMSGRLKLAITLRALLRLTVQLLPLTEHGPVHPTKPEFAPAVAVRVIDVPAA